MKFRVSHTTTYSYNSPVSLCRNQACLLPRQTPRQNCLSSLLRIDPVPVDLRERTDPFGNRISHFALQHGHERLKVTALSEVEVISPPNCPSPDNQPNWEQVAAWPTNNRSPETVEAFPFLYDSPLIHRFPALKDYARLSFPSGRPVIEATRDLMQRIYSDFAYDPESTTVHTPLTDVFDHRRGVCQDFAHLAIGCLRLIGLAARYVSGYIETIPPPGKVRLVGADASHAWFSIFVPGIGWIDFDPTNNQLPSEQHITVAWGRDFSDVSPLKGVALGGGLHTVAVSVDVARISTGDE